MPYHRPVAVQYSEDHFVEYGPIPGLTSTCQQYVYRSNLAGGLRVPEKPVEKESLPSLPLCKRPKYPLSTEDEFMKGEKYFSYLTGYLQCPQAHWGPGDLPATPGEVGQKLGTRLCPGDDVFFIWKDGSGHAVIVVDTSPDRITFKGQNDPDPWQEYRADLLKWTSSKKNSIDQFYVVHIPDSIRHCKSPHYVLHNDSTVGIIFRGPPCSNSGAGAGWIRHQWHCCWHENLANTWPWYSDSSAYICLSWQENSGHTWDSLVSPRYNLNGCSAVVLDQASYSNLQHGAGKVVEVRGSTDNGVTWPYLLGDDALQEAALPWADSQPNVRIAWVYMGPIQVGGYWCVDDMDIWARPTRERDASVSGIADPCGIMTQGTPVVPAAYVWNHGKWAESLGVTMHVGTGYSDTRWVKLYPYTDTLLEFTTWSAVPGTYTATCYALLDSDECRANDTAALTFRVVADTWVSVFPTYGGGGMERGACLAPVDSDNIYCVTGKYDFFARYIVSQNLWKNRTCTPEGCGVGAGMAYPGTGPDLYALRGGGSQSFYRYRSDCNYWEYLAQTPGKINQGGALVWGGGNYLYALRGYQSKDFYRYNIINNTWDTRAQTPAKISLGGALVWTGGDSLYALRGGQHPDFYLYRISTNQWATLTPSPTNVQDGGALAYYPQGNKIYAFCGDGSYYFYAYNISSNTWSSRGNAPGPVHNGGCLTYCDYSIFGGLGEGRDTNFWRYSPPVGGLDEPEPGLVPAELPMEPASVSATGDVHVGYGGDFGEELLTYDPTDKLTPDFSPSDSWITFTADDTTRGCYALYRIRSTGGLPQPVSSDGRTYENPKWSHDGAWLIVKADDGIFRLDPSGMSSTRLAQGVTSLPRWSDNDSWVIYERWDTTLHTHRTCRVRPNGTQDTCLSIDASECLSPQPVSDSEVVCVKLKDEVYQLCLVRNGQTIWLTSDYMNNTSPCVSPNRQWCTFEKLDESGYWQVYRIRLNGTDEARLSDGTCNCKTPTYSPDGHNIAYSKWPADSTGSSEFSQICYVPDSGGQETALNQPNAIRKNPCWSHDCTYIVYQRTLESGDFAGGRGRHYQLARARTRIRYSGVEELKAIPTEFALYQNRPNPFHARTTIRYALPTRARADLTIYDIAGRSVTKLVQSEQKAGYYAVRWNGSDARGRTVPAGTYFYVLKANGKIAQKRMLLVR